MISRFFLYLRMGSLAVLCMAALTAAPVLYFMQARAGSELAATAAARDAAEQTLRQLRSDSAAARELRGRIGAEEARRTLAPVDRLEAAAAIERMASSFRLGNFAYTFEPEKSVKIDDAEGQVTLATSDITLAADAPSDVDVVDFITQLCRLLPGRLAVEKMSIERVGDEKTALTTANVRFKATLTWLSNGAATTMAAAP